MCKQAFVCKQVALGHCVGNGRACWGLESDWHWVSKGVEEAEGTGVDGKSYLSILNVNVE